MRASYNSHSIPTEFESFSIKVQYRNDSWKDIASWNETLHFCVCLDFQGESRKKKLNV